MNDCRYYTRKKKYHLGLLAQLVEQRTLNPWVIGSSPIQAIGVFTLLTTGLVVEYALCAMKLW